MPTIYQDSVAEEINRSRALLQQASKVGVKEAARIAGVHPATLWRLKKRAKNGGRLFDGRHLNPGAASCIDETRMMWALGYLAAHQGVAIAQVCKELNLVAMREKWPATNYHSLRRAIAKLPSDLKTILMEGGKAVYENTAIVGQRVSSRPLELVQADFTETPVWTVNPATGETMAAYMSGTIDTYSRVVMGLEFHLTPPDAISAARAFTKAFLPKGDARMPFFGMPETVQTDNAKVYIGGLLSAMAVRAGFILDYTPINCPGANGKIERFFQTFESYFFSKLPGYTAQSNGKAKAEARGVIPYTVLQSLAQKALFEYHSTVHSGIGTTPWEAWHEGVQNSPGYFLPPREMREKLRIGIAVDVKREGVTVLGSQYSGKCLAGMVDMPITVLTSAAGGDQSVDAYFAGNFIGKLRPVPFVADEINQARLGRTMKLSSFRKKMRESLKKCPPTDAPQTVVPSEERKRIRSEQKKTPRKRTIKPARFEVETQKEVNE